MIEVGTESRSFIQIVLAVDEDFTKFCSYCCKCFVAAVSYLQIIQYQDSWYAQYLHSGKRNGSLSHNSISNLVLKIASIFGSKVANVFNVSPAKTQVEIADMVRHEWKMHQLKEILE